MRRSWFQILVTGAVLLAVTRAAAGETVRVVVDAPLAAPAAQALADLERALRTQGREVVRQAALPDTGPAVVVGLADSTIVRKLLETNRIELPRSPESLCIRKLRDILLVAGRDARGLGYALLEAARAVELAPRGSDLLAAVSEAVEEPFLRHRSMTVHPVNADLEEDWYFDERFWRAYFALLAACRYNNFTLTFGDQTNYLTPLYSYLAEVPGHPQVRVKGLDDASRRRHLAMLKRIAELAHERGLDFTLGVWMQLPVPRYTGRVLVEQLPEGLAAADYCAAGLGQVLRACPAIDAVQLRMNSEAGVPEEKQTAFYKPLFQAIRDCGRPVRVDLRYKGLRPETTEAARALGLNVTVSTKFWCEHMGLPYHPTEADRHYRESRYSFGAMLEQPRNYRVVYQLWTVGSQRLLLWGDPDYAARFARACRLGDGEGFEVFAPLTNKGFGDLPGKWRIFADRSLEHFTWEYERYGAFYLLFGRFGYNPQTDGEVWRRELRHRFGPAAGALEMAYRQASQVVPLVTAARLPSASEWSWWPELDTGDRLPEYVHTPPSDTGQFYAVRAWRRTPRWRCEEWDAEVPGYVEDAVAGRLRPKWTPPQVSRRLRALAEGALRDLDRARAQVPDAKAAEFRATELDLRVLAQLALYHADKTMAATHLAFFELTGEAGRLPPALRHMREAAAAWERLVRLTDGAYHANLVFGYSPQHNRRLGHHHSGHWKDRLPEVREDVAHLEELLRKHGGEGKPARTFPGEEPPADLPRVEHDPVKAARPGEDLVIEARITSKAPLRQVVLRYRPLNQTMAWKQLPLEKTGEGRFRVVVPGKDVSARWDLQYYFEVLTEGGSGRLWPSWEEGPPYVVVAVHRNGN